MGSALPPACTTADSGATGTLMMPWAVLTTSSKRLNLDVVEERRALRCEDPGELAEPLALVPGRELGVGKGLVSLSGGLPCGAVDGIDV